MHRWQRTYDSRLLQIPEIEREYRDLTRDYENAQTRYREVKAKQMQAEVSQELEKDRKAAQAFTATLARQVMNLRTRIEQRNIRSARERVRHFLALNTGADGRTIELGGTLKDLAAELALTHEALYRTLAALERGGEIKRGRGKITLLRTRKI